MFLKSHNKDRYYYKYSNFTQKYIKSTFGKSVSQILSIEMSKMQRISHLQFHMNSNNFDLNLYTGHLIINMLVFDHVRISSETGFETCLESDMLEFGCHDS